MENASFQHLIFENKRMEIYLHGAHESGFNNARTICQRHLHHMMFEVNIVLAGSQVVIFNDYSYEQHTGELVLIPPMTVHQYKTEKAQFTKFFVAHIKITDINFLQKIATIAPLFIQQRNSELTDLVKPLVYDLMNKLKKMHLIYPFSKPYWTFHFTLRITVMKKLPCSLWERNCLMKSPER